MHARIHAHAYAHAYTHACMHARTRTRARMHERTHPRTHAHTNARTHAHVHTHTRTLTRARTHARARARTRTHARARTHTRMITQVLDDSVRHGSHGPHPPAAHVPLAAEQRARTSPAFALQHAAQHSAARRSANSFPQLSATSCRDRRARVSVAPHGARRNGSRCAARHVAARAAGFAPRHCRVVPAGRLRRDRVRR
jgi:hypothetical protein